MYGESRKITLTVSLRYGVIKQFLRHEKGRPLYEKLVRRTASVFFTFFAKNPISETKDDPVVQQNLSVCTASITLFVCDF